MLSRIYSILPLLLSGSIVLGANVSSPLVKRAECGPGVGSCPAGKCCSEAGWCGNSAAHCAGSTCQLDYSDSCDTFFPPPGISTESVSRPEIGTVPYGNTITECTKPGLMALTFDDGPFTYTSQILDILDNLNVQATFFVAGNNKGKKRIDDTNMAWPAVLRRMHAAGHQIASHSWSHRNLNQVNSTIQRTEIIYNEMAFRNLLGWFPTYFRAPFLECSSTSGCQSLMKTLGYHLLGVNVDTKDYMYDSPTLIQTAKDRFSQAVSQDPTGKGYIVLAHDVHVQTVVNLTQYMIETSKARGYRLVTVGECLGDPRANWYRPVKPSPSTTRTSATTVSTRTSSTAVPTSNSGLKISPDQTCGGGAAGFTCQGSKYGNCCSFYGFCGSSPAYCGTGCNTGYGTCTQLPAGLSDTTNGLCGTRFNASCKNYGNKNCCSQSGFCGSSAAHCGVGCQNAFGICG
ncbi:hypothetical protein VD0001_g7828 [Verticillium dahliae]|nr:hypothetical protein VD0001_g7828 [Verticillium dahliae]